MLNPISGFWIIIGLSLTMLVLLLWAVFSLDKRQKREIEKLRTISERKHQLKRRRKGQRRQGRGR